MTHEALVEEVRRRQQELTHRRCTIANLTTRIERTKAQRQQTLDLLGQDAQGRPLRLTPLLWALAGGVMALSAAFFTYLTGLMALRSGRPDSDFDAGGKILGSFPVSGIWLRMVMAPHQSGYIVLLVPPLGSPRLRVLNPAGKVSDSRE
jgi:hypothetical protein